MKSILTFILSVATIFLIQGQTFTSIREMYVNEVAIGNLQFIQDDFDGDGDIEFLADAYNRRNFFIGHIQGNEIITTHSSNQSISDYDFRQLRYEDTNGDLRNELYVLYSNNLLVRLDTLTFLPVDTIDLSVSTSSIRSMLLLDINEDQQKEWIIMNDSYGLFVINPADGSLISKNDTIKGRAIHIVNLDQEPDLELVLVKNKDTYIMDLATFTVEHIFPGVNPINSKVHDLNHDGIHELMVCDLQHYKVYHHQTKTLEVYTSTSHDFGDSFFFDIDGNEVDEIVLYKPDGDNLLTQLTAYPLTLSVKYEIEGIDRFGKFLDIYLPDPSIVLFNLPATEYGLVIYDPLSRKARVTEQSGLSYGLLIDRLGIEDKESFIARPDEGSGYFDLFALPEMEKKDRLVSADLFKELNVGFNDEIHTYHHKGMDNNMLVVQDYPHISIVDLAKGPHKEFYNFIPSFEKIVVGDIDFDGNIEFLMHDYDDGLIIRNFNGSFDYTDRIFQSPENFSPEIRTVQLNETPEKEIILFDAFDLYILNGLNGEEIDHFVYPVPGYLRKLTTYSDGHGNFYLAMANDTSIYIHNYTTQSFVNRIPINNEDEFFDVHLDHFQLITSDTAETYFTLFVDKFYILNDTGEVLLVSDEELSNGSDIRMLIADYDKDMHANIFTFSYNKLTEYEHTGTGIFQRPFHLTGIFPENGSALNHLSPFFIQFSEPVDPLMAKSQIEVISQKHGPLNFNIEQNVPLQFDIVPLSMIDEADTIRIRISGNLQSKLARFADYNYDMVAFGAHEEIFESFYVINPVIPNNTVTISATGPLPVDVYTDNIRFYPFTIQSESLHGPAVPIAAVQTGIMSAEIIQRSFNLPVDSAFDEVLEEVNVALNTFGLSKGSYTGFLVAMDYHGYWSDTFFFPFTLIEEGKHMDKNPGSNRNSSFAFDNDLQSTPYALKKILTHAPFTKISDVTGGDGAIYYSELPNSGTTGKIHKIDLKTFTSDWVRILPMEDQPPPLHLDNGFLYFYNYTDQLWEYNAVTIDALTGNVENNTPYSALVNYVATPITDEFSLLMPGGSPRGYYSFNRWTGQINWFREIEPYAVDQESAATLYGDMAYIMKGRFVYALEKSSGSLIWTFEHGAPVLQDITYVIADEKNQQLLVTALDSLYAIDAETGSVNWSQPVAFNHRQSILHGSEVIHFGIDYVSVYDALSGTLKRQKLHSGLLHGQPIAANGKIFIPYSSNMVVWDIATLSGVWSVNVAAADISVLDDYLILRNGNSLHIYQSENQCCNPSITMTEFDILDAWGNMRSHRLTFDAAPVVRNNMEYHELLLSATETGDNYAHTGIYFRSEDKKVYRYESGVEKLVFDFALNVDDTFENEYGGNELVVTALDSVDLLNGERRLRLTLNCGAEFYWIENIGSTLGLLTPQSYCGFDIGSELLCYYENDVQLFMHETINACWLMPTPTIEIQSNSVTFSPNPVTDELVISDPDQVLSSFAITDIYGRILKKGNGLHIEVGSLIRGIYILHFNQKDGQVESNVIIKL